MINKFLIYEDWNHFIPTGKSWYTGLVQNDKIVYQLGHNEALNNVEEKLDVVIYFDLPTNSIEIDILRRYKNENKNTIIVGIVGDKFKSVFNEYKDCIDVWCSMMYSYDSLEKTFNNNGMDLYFLPLAADHEIFFPTNSKKIYDVSFIGQFGNTGHGYRREDKYLYPLLERKELKKYMSGFNYNGESYSFTKYSELNNIYNSTKVNLNFHYDNQKTDDRIDFNGRTYEIAMSGNVQLCDHPACQDVFDGHMFWQYENKWVEYVNGLLYNQTNAQEFCQKNRNYFIDKHSWKTRMKTLIKILEKL